MRSTILVFVAAAGCSESRSLPEQHLPKADDSFTLFVSNQSFALDPVDIRVELDGQLAVTGDFEVGSQHTFVRFDMPLAAGTHDIRVTTADVADVVLDETFVMDDRKFATLMFWYYPPGTTEPTPPRFSWRVSDEQPGFD
jgi:hypothetical protein